MLRLMMPDRTFRVPARAALNRLAAKAAATFLVASLLASCGGSSGEAPAPAPSGPPVATVLGVTLASPWSLAFLPDGRMLVTQKGGSMVIVRADGSAVDSTVGGVPAVNTIDQGGLLDVALDPDFATTQRIFFTFSEQGSDGLGTALARARLVGSSLQDVQVVWRQQPKVWTAVHYGSRIVFRPDRTLFVTLGDRGTDDPANPTADNAQNPAKTIGKIVRLTREGTAPPDNPRLAQPAALPEIYSLGHRNVQGAVLMPGTGELWVSEHGPQGGDEINRIVPGANYGWPLRSYGCPYGSPVGDACRVGGGTHAPAFEEPKTIWVPTSIAPAGLIVYTGSRFPEWRGQLFSGALAGRSLWRISVDATGSVTAREEIAAVKALNKRIRDVRQGPDGWIYLLTDDGRLVRVER